MNKYIENVTQRFGPFYVANHKSKLVPGNLERYLNDMIPGFRDISKRHDPSADDNSEQIQSELQQNHSGSNLPNIKREPIHDEQSESEQYLEADQTHQHPDFSIMLNEIERLKKVVEDQAAVNAQQAEMIEKLKEEIRSNNDEFKVQRQNLEHLFQEEQLKLANELKEAKKKQWCSECSEMISSATQTCQICSIFQ